MANEWPLRTFLELGALPGAVPSARLHVRQLLWEWGLTQFDERVELLVSELLTNALKATWSMEEAFAVRLWVLSDQTRVLILVWDANPQPPVRVNANEDAESGRGLLLVETISAQWDWYVSPDKVGKVVWSLVTAREQRA